MEVLSIVKLKLHYVHLVSFSSWGYSQRLLFRILSLSIHFKRVEKGPFELAARTGTR